MELADKISEISLDKLNYSDVKVNVLLEYNNKRVVAELQFLLSIFLHYKKGIQPIRLLNKDFINNYIVYKMIYH